MKKLLLIILSLVAMSASAQSLVSDGTYNYDIYDASSANPYLVVVKVVKSISSGQYEIPDYVPVNSRVILPVKGIGKKLFYNNWDLNSISFGKNLEWIDDSAFCNCGNLDIVTFSGPIKRIGNYAFYSTSLNEDFKIPEGLEEIGKSAFSWSTLKSIKLPEGLRIIGPYAFFNSNLLEAEIPSSVDSIGNYAFHTNAMTDVIINSQKVLASGQPMRYIFGFQVKRYTVGEGVTVIGDYAFSADIFEAFSKVEKVVLPKSVTIIKQRAFNYCTSLVTLVIPHDSELGVIGENAFFNCLLLGDIFIPSKVYQIDTGAFYTLGPLLHVVDESNFPLNKADDVFWERDSRKDCTVYAMSEERAKRYRELGFKCDFYLQKKDLPDDDYTEELKYKIVSQTDMTCEIIADPNKKYGGNITIPEVINGYTVVGIADSAFCQCKALTNVTLPGTIKYIGQYAFIGCSGLSMFNFPASVESIGTFSFNDCVSMNTIVLNWLKPITYPVSTFLKGEVLQSKDRTLVVPLYAKPEYEKTRGWNWYNIVGVGTVPNIEDVNADGNVNGLDALKVYKYIQQH